MPAAEDEVAGTDTHAVKFRQAEFHGSGDAGIGFAKNIIPAQRVANAGEETVNTGNGCVVKRLAAAVSTPVTAGLENPNEQPADSFGESGRILAGGLTQALVEQPVK